jgi:hypothetical protein
MQLRLRRSYIADSYYNFERRIEKDVEESGLDLFEIYWNVSLGTERNNEFPQSV